jgi:hypothetical protein
MLILPCHRAIDVSGKLYAFWFRRLYMVKARKFVKVAVRIILKLMW